MVYCVLLLLLLFPRTTQGFGASPRKQKEVNLGRCAKLSMVPRQTCQRSASSPPVLPSAWRLVLLSLFGLRSSSPADAAVALSTSTLAQEIQATESPITRTQNPKIDLATISKLQEQAFQATNRFQWKEADRAWTKVIDLDPENAAAISNRGNTRTSMGLCAEAKEDFDRAIALAPKEPDPNLGRGVAEECLGQYEAALQDYAEANRKNVALTGKEDPVTYNNRANAKAGLGRWEEAVKDYRQAAKMQPGYVFPLASAALASYQLGDDAEAIKQMRLLLVKYPQLVDMRAALAVIYWKEGDFSKAETAWYNAINEDPRYRRIEWVRTVRRWPPRMIEELDAFLNLKLPGSSKAAKFAAAAAEKTAAASAAMEAAPTSTETTAAAVKFDD